MLPGLRVDCMNMLGSPFRRGGGLIALVSQWVGWHGVRVHLPLLYAFFAWRAYVKAEKHRAIFEVRSPVPETCCPWAARDLAFVHGVIATAYGPTRAVRVAWCVWGKPSSALLL